MIYKCKIYSDVLNTTVDGKIIQLKNYKKYNSEEYPYSKLIKLHPEYFELVDQFEMNYIDERVTKTSNGLLIDEASDVIIEVEE